MNPKTKEELEEELHEKYRQLCEKNREKQVTTVSWKKGEKEQTESVFRKENKD